MASFNPPTLQAGCLEDLGTTPAYAIDDAATPRRIWKLWNPCLMVAWGRRGVGLHVFRPIPQRWRASLDPIPLNRAGHGV